jgi:hypothetical protein
MLIVGKGAGCNIAAVRRIIDLSASKSHEGRWHRAALTLPGLHAAPREEHKIQRATSRRNR